MAQAQGLTVLPVIIQMAPGQAATTITVENHDSSETSFQVRAFAWNQRENADQLAPTDALLVSPPLGIIAAQGRQVMRLVLRRPPQGSEAAYRIWLDQIPPPAAPGTVRIALRLSIPIFAEPLTRVAPHVEWRIESSGGQAGLTGVNTGTRHDAVRDITLTSADNRPLKIESGTSPYVLAGATRRWRIVSSGPPLGAGARLHLAANADSGRIDQAVAVTGSP